MRYHCIVPPIPPKMPRDMLPMPVWESLTACPVDSITLDAASSGFALPSHPGLQHHLRYNE